MTDRDTPSLARRSSLPLAPPPYLPPTISSPKQHTSTSFSVSGSSRAATSGGGRGATQSPPLLYRDPTFPMRDPAPSSSHPISSSRHQHQPPHAPSSSASSSSSMSRRPSDPSTAPTTPQIGSTSRTWRPTPHVPTQIQRRHRQNPFADEPTGSSEQHRWLSEDEGTGGGPSRLAGRRRRREHRSSDPRAQDDEGGYGSAGPSSSSTARNHATAPRASSRSRPTTGRSRMKPERIESAMDTVTNSKRPIIRRALSMEHRSSSPSQSTSDVGAQPPRISDLVPPPTSPVAIARGMGSSSGATFTTHVAESAAPAPSEDRPDSVMSNVPDYAPGRGGDGIGGTGRPSGDDKDIRNQAQARIERQKEMLGKLRRILACVFCAHPANETAPLLHHPITLPCGHTLSAEHVTLPSPPRIQYDPSLPAHEIFALQQRQHAQRLSLWASVMCPIPSCKRYSPTASSTPINPTSDHTLDAEQLGRVSSGAQRGEMLASGVTYYPPPPMAPPEYSSDPPVTEVGSPLLDISVEKIINIVQREMSRIEDDTYTTTTALRNVELHDREDIDIDTDQTRPATSPALSDESSSSSSSANLGRAPSKRRRNRLDLHDNAPEGQDRSEESYRRSPGQGRARSGMQQHQGFEKDILSVLECDVCASLLHEPVTTPCQHSFCSKCLSRSLDHSSRCPVCRQDLPSFAFFQDHAVNRVLLTILKSVFANEYDDRSAAIERDERDARLDTPIFVCTLAFPGMPTILHVFEPRYRLMIRRCIESANPRFGMVLPNRGTGAPHLQGVMEYGTMLEIQSVQMLPDGRSMVETVGTHRFKLLEKGSLDGYTVGRIEKIEDISPEEERELEAAALEAARTNPPRPRPHPAVQTTQAHPAHAAAAAAAAASGQVIPNMPNPNVIANQPSTGMPPQAGPAAGSIPLEETAHTTEDYMDICRSFIDQLRSGSAPWLLQRLNNTYGTMPNDPSEFSYWMALVMPIDEYEKARLLPIRSARLRLKLIVHWIDSLRSSWWFSSGCVVG